jgi:cytochrome oxidase Cu insertion factor (SCO1/SenC/PrrC family)
MHTAVPARSATEGSPRPTQEGRARRSAAWLVVLVAGGVAGGVAGDGVAGGATSGVTGSLTTGGLAGGARAQAAAAEPSVESTVVPGPPDEARYVNREVPDIRIRTAAGDTRLSTLWAQGPVMLTMVFVRCAGVCSPYLRALRAADEAIGAPADVRRVVLSFDVRDTIGDMASTAAHLGVAGRDGWFVGVADPADIERLSRALGFWFAWDESRQQFDHPAMLAGIRNGRVARLLVGGTMTSARLAEVVRESRGQFVASYPLPGAVRWRCFEYDPATGEASLTWGALVLTVPAFGAAMVTFGLFRPLRTRRRLRSSNRGIEQPALKPLL